MCCCAEGFGLESVLDDLKGDLVHRVIPRRTYTVTVVISIINLLTRSPLTLQVWGPWCILGEIEHGLYGLGPGFLI